MALKFLFFHLITAMVAVNLIFADEELERLLPFFSFLGGGANSSSGLPNLSNLPFFGSFGSGLVPSFFESRQERSADHHESRSLFGNIVSCNYTTQGLSSCSSCNQTLLCFSNNVGIQRTCRGPLRHCNNGWCSSVPTAECSNSTSNTTGAALEG